MSNYNRGDKQCDISSRTFDIVPKTATPRNLFLERGSGFNQFSNVKDNTKPPTMHMNVLKNPQERYVNPYAITQLDFSSDYKPRKNDRQNRTNIYDERMLYNSKFMNKTSSNPYTERMNIMDQNNTNVDRLKHSNPQKAQSFQEYLEFQHNMTKSNGKPKY